MTVFAQRDLRAFCRTQGVPVAFAGVSAYDDGEAIKGLFDRPMQFKLMGEGIGGTQSALPELRLPLNAFDPMPDSGDTVTLTDECTGAVTAYTVCAPTTEDDGAFLCYELEATS